MDRHAEPRADRVRQVAARSALLRARSDELLETSRQLRVHIGDIKRARDLARPRRDDATRGRENADGGLTAN